MDNNELLSTKKRIIDAAKKLFGEEGFNATSTREIAALAQVNLAGLHYHFTSKQHLYEQVVVELFIDAENRFMAMYNERACSTEDFIVRALEALLDEEHSVMEKYRIILLGSVKLLAQRSDKALPPQLAANNRYCGPLGSAIEGCITRELGRDRADADVAWAVRVLVAYVEMNTLRFHLTFGTPFAEGPGDLISGARRLANAVLREIGGGS